ncbi:MAG: hypothetical protein WAK66_11170 [Methylocystis sp.]
MKMVLADEAHSARLRPFFSHLLDESDFGADCQTVEGIIENTVAVKKNLAAIGGFDESTILSSEEFRHMAVVFPFMRLYLTAHFADSILNLALGRAECILDRDRDMLVLRRVVVSLGHDDVFVRRHGDADVDLEQTALLMPRPRRDDGHIAARDPIMKFLQMPGVPFDLGANFLRRLGVLEGDIKRCLHGMLLYLIGSCVRPCFSRGLDIDVIAMTSPAPRAPRKPLVQPTLIRPSIPGRSQSSASFLAYTGRRRLGRADPLFPAWMDFIPLLSAALRA